MHQYPSLSKGALCSTARFSSYPMSYTLLQFSLRLHSWLVRDRLTQEKPDLKTVRRLRIHSKRSYMLSLKHILQCSQVVYSHIGDWLFFGEDYIRTDGRIVGPYISVDPSHKRNTLSAISFDRSVLIVPNLFQKCARYQGDGFLGCCFRWGNPFGTNSRGHAFHTFTLNVDAPALVDQLNMRASSFL